MQVRHRYGEKCVSENTNFYKKCKKCLRLKILYDNISMEQKRITIRS